MCTHICAEGKGGSETREDIVASTSQEELALPASSCGASRSQHPVSPARSVLCQPQATNAAATLKMSLLLPWILSTFYPHVCSGVREGCLHLPAGRASGR